MCRAGAPRLAEAGTLSASLGFRAHVTFHVGGFGETSCSTYSYSRVAAGRRVQYTVCRIKDETPHR